MHAKSLQSCLTLWDPMDYSPPVSVHGILQARILEWVAMPSSRGSSQLRDRIHVCYVSCIGGGFLTTSATWKLLFNSVQSLNHVQFFATPWTAASQAFLSITNSGACSNSCPLSRWCHPTISSSVVPFSSCLQSFPASGSFLMSQFFASRGQSIGAYPSATVLPLNIQDWVPLGLTAFISLQSKRLSRVFSNTTVQKHQFFGTQLSL